MRRSVKGKYLAVGGSEDECISEIELLSFERC